MIQRTKDRVVFDKVEQAIRKEFLELQRAGYMTPENEEMEVGMGIEIAVRRILNTIESILAPEDCIIVDGKVYHKADIRKLPEIT